VGIGKHLVLKQRFVVLSHSRSGSTLLLNALGQHPHVLACGELFNDEDRDRDEMPAGFQLHNPASPIRYQNNSSGHDFLHHILYEADYPAPVAAVGWKLLYDQALHPPTARTVWSFLQSRRDIRVIRLCRQNLLEAWVSLQTAMETGQWHVQVDSVREVVAVPPVTVSISAFEAYVHEILGFLKDSDARFCGHSTIEVEYQRDLCSNFAGTMSRIQEFLGLEYHASVPGLRKLAHQTLRSRVSNYDEILLHFQRTPLLSHVVPPNHE
jgi:LPS sulfotransferase NodH